MTGPQHPSLPPADPPVPSCPDLPVEDLVAWLDGETAAGAVRSTADVVAAHVASCARCAREADLLRRAGDAVARLPRCAARGDFPDRVLRAAAAEPVAPGRVVPLRRSAAVRRVVAAAAVLVVAVGAWWVATAPSEPGRLSAREEEEIARDLYVLAHLDTLSEAEAEELASLADDLDAIETAADTEGDGG